MFVKALPSIARFSDDTKYTVDECVTEFICFVTSEANDKVRREKRSIIKGEDILWAMSTLGMEKQAKLLSAYLIRYRLSAKQKMTNTRRIGQDT